MITDDLLNEYKKFDNICNLKILVSYIKPSFLFKTNILTPIHLGRSIAKESSKDGEVNENDLNWLYENCIGDNDSEDNISDKNRRIGFLTGTYWARKNYDKLNNPEFFGSFGYRKLFTPDFLKEFENYDLILPQKRKLSPRTNKTNFIDYHSSNLYQSAINNFQKIYPQKLKAFEEYMDLDEGYYHEIYVMKRDIFFEFCSWIFPLLESCLQDKNCKKINDYSSDKISVQNFMYKNDKRDIAFIMEIYTGFFLYSMRTKVPAKEFPIIELELKKEKEQFRKNLINLILTHQKTQEKK